MQFSARTVGLASAAVTVLIWTSFIVIARASASHTLLPLRTTVLAGFFGGLLNAMLVKPAATGAAR